MNFWDTPYFDCCIFSSSKLIHTSTQQPTGTYHAEYNPHDVGAHITLEYICDALPYCDSHSCGAGTNLRQFPEYRACDRGGKCP